MEEVKGVPENPANVSPDEQGAAEDPPAAEPAAAESSEDGSGELAAVTAERDRLLAEKAELTDLLMRRQAEFENYRRRSEREKSEIWDKASMETVRAILPVLDDFERAIQVSSSDAEYARGAELIYQRLVDALTRMGLEPIAADGAKFDPNLHQALDTQPTEDVEEDTIVQVYAKGYLFKGVLLRAAMVKVSVRP